MRIKPKLKLTGIFLQGSRAPAEVKDSLIDQTANNNQCYRRNYAQTVKISKWGITSVGEIDAEHRFTSGPE